MKVGLSIKDPMNLLTFGTFHHSNMQISNFPCKNDFYLTLTACQAKGGRNIKNPINLFTFGTFDNSNMRISILMPKMILIKHILPVRQKMVAILKIL